MGVAGGRGGGSGGAAADCGEDLLQFPSGVFITLNLVTWNF